MEEASSIALAKAQRTNLTNRRTVAFILEMIPVNVLGGLALSFIDSSSQLLPWAPFTFWLMIRDLGDRSWGKKVVGLDLASADGSPSISARARFLRNVFTGIVPGLVVVEYFYVHYGNRRLGDRIAGTSVVDRSPGRHGQGSWSKPLILALAGNLIAVKLLLPYLIRLVHPGAAG